MSFLHNLEALIGLAHKQPAQSTPAATQKTAAVSAKDNAPLQNEYNSKGQPTYEILNDPGPITFPNQPGTQYPAHNQVMRHIAPLAPALNKLMQLRVGAPQTDLGSNNYAPQGVQNPGYTPLQTGGMGAQGNPQIGAFSTLQSAGHQNPQINDRGFYAF